MSAKALVTGVNPSERSPIVFRYLIPLLLFVSLFPVSSASAQGNKPNLSATSGKRDLVLKTTGDGRILGRRASFRIYEAPDGSQSVVWYGTFASDEQAESAIKQWIQPYKVTRKDQAKDHNGDVIGERIVGSMKNHKTGGMEYLLVRRDTLNYWRIQSKSLTDAMQLDASINASSLIGQ